MVGSQFEITIPAPSPEFELPVIDDDEIEKLSLEDIVRPTSEDDSIVTS